MRIGLRPTSFFQVVGSGAVLDALGNYIFQGYSLGYLVFMFAVGGLLILAPLVLGQKGKRN